MPRNSLSRLILPVSLFAFTACQVGTSAELEVDEGAAYLTVIEDDADEMGTAGLVDEADESVVDDLVSEETQSLPDPASAEDSAPCTFEGLRARVVQGYDADGDGALSQDERRALRSDIDQLRTQHPRLSRISKVRRHARFHLIRWAFDENNDRMLDEFERQTLVDALEARCLARRAERIETYDANGNGSLDPDELAALRADRRARFAARRAAVLAQFDADQDGVLSLAERQAWKAHVKARFQARKAELKEAFDVDGDGRLSESERAAAKAMARENIASANRPFES